MKKLFYARHFQPTTWDTAEEKAEFANLFVRFVESGFNRQFFTGKFYQRLVCMFGFHAFPDSQNFWNHYFDDPAGRARFIESCLAHKHQGAPGTTFADAETHLQEWLRGRFNPKATEGAPDPEHTANDSLPQASPGSPDSLATSPDEAPESDSGNTQASHGKTAQSSFVW